MFISAKRHERELQELRNSATPANRLCDAILKTSSLGLFLLDSTNKIQPQVSASLGKLFRRQDFSDMTRGEAVGTVGLRQNPDHRHAYIALLLDPARGETEAVQSLAGRRGEADECRRQLRGRSLLLRIQRRREPGRTRSWMVRVTDITARAQQQRELEDLRVQVQTQGEILRSVLQAGGARFGAFLQKTDASMKTINGVLKKPAREAGAFRNKLVETLEEVDRIRRDAAAFKLAGLQAAAREFEDALQELRSRENLSGSDFLPLAVKLDALYGQFALLRSLTMQANPPARENAAGREGARHRERNADHRIPEILRRTGAEVEPPRQRMAPVGSLENTLATLTDLVAQENHKAVVIECSGYLVPPRYQATVKNVAIQLIRNAVVHGIEAPASACRR